MFKLKPHWVSMSLWENLLLTRCYPSSLWTSCYLQRFFSTEREYLSKSRTNTRSLSKLFVIWKNIKRTVSYQGTTTVKADNGKAGTWKISSLQQRHYNIAAILFILRIRLWQNLISLLHNAYDANQFCSPSLKWWFL